MRPGFAIMVVMGAVAYGGALRAQQSPIVRGEAARLAQIRVLRQAAELAATRGDHPGALAAAERLEQLSAEPSVLMFIANEHHALYHAEASRAYAQRCIDAVTVRPNPDREAQSVLGRCRELRGSAENALGSIRLVLPDHVPVGTRVFVAGTMIPQEEWERPRPSPVGQIEVEATAPGHLVWRQVVAVRGNETSEAQVQLERVPVATATPCPTCAQEPTTHPSRTVPVVMMVAGGALLLGGGAIALFAERPLLEEFHACTGSLTVCPAGNASDQRIADLVDSLYRVRIAEYALMGFGLGVAVGGLVSFIHTGGRASGHAPTQAPVRVQAAVSPSGAMLQIGGTL